jgi:hypothetical protein
MKTVRWAEPKPASMAHRCWNPGSIGAWIASFTFFCWSGDGCCSKNQLRPGRLLFGGDLPDDPPLFRSRARRDELRDLSAEGVGRIRSPAFFWLFLFFSFGDFFIFSFLTLCTRIWNQTRSGTCCDVSLGFSLSLSLSLSFLSLFRQKKLHLFVRVLVL